MGHAQILTHKSSYNFFNSCVLLGIILLLFIDLLLIISIVNFIDKGIFFFFLNHEDIQ